MRLFRRSQPLPVDLLPPRIEDGRAVPEYVDIAPRALTRKPKAARSSGRKRVLLFLGLIAMGIVFRFVHLDRKEFWYDESITSLRLAGRSRGELIAREFRGRELAPGDLAPYRDLDPARGLSGVVRSLRIEDAHHPPLYYASLWLWAGRFGDSVAALRAWSAVLSVLALAGMFWLCRELFDSRWVAWTATALLSISPFQLAFAQEAREYSLFAVTVLVSSAALLRALRRDTATSWALYAVTLALGLYTSLFTGVVMLGHLLFAWIGGRFRVDRSCRKLLLSSVLALVAFSPWIVDVIAGRVAVIASNEWSGTSMPFLRLVETWAVEFGRFFVDFDQRPGERGVIVGVVPVLLLEAIALIGLARWGPRRAATFVFASIGAAFLALAIPDLVVGGQRSAVGRYLVPVQLGLVVALAFSLVEALRSPTAGLRLTASVVLAAVFAAGVSSFVVSSSADSWWNKGVASDDPAIARVVNASDHPLVVADARGSNPGKVLALSRMLKPSARFFLCKRVDSASLGRLARGGARDVFVLDAATDDRARIGAPPSAGLEHRVGGLWQISR
jgi:uncharacterized membrane protein